MKNLIKFLCPFTFFVLVSLTWSCTSDSQDENIPNIENLKACFPSNDYKDNSKIRFLNERGEERVFSISYEEIEPDSRFEFPPFCLTGGELNFSPLIEENAEVVTLTDDVFVGYTIFFILDSSSDGTDLTARIVERFGTPTTAACNKLNQTGLLLFSLPKDDSLGDSMTLLGQDFENVLTGFWPGNDGFTTVYYNQEFGMLGFLDEFQELYVFDSYQ